MIMMIIMMIIVMIMIILVMCMIFYTFFLSSCSSHVTCFQEWHCDQCGMTFNFERNYQYHVKHCCGVNRYKCSNCENVYWNKKSLWHHTVKQHGNDVCCLTFFCREFVLYEFLTYIIHMCIGHFS